MNYVMSKPLPATRVTRELIKQILDLISKQISDLTNSDDDFEKNISRLTISISDKIGAEEFHFSDQLPQKFSGDTECVEISLNGVFGTGAEGLRISIRFDKIRPRILVGFSGKNSKTTALGISESIISIVRAYGNSNSWAHHYGRVLVGTLILNGLLIFLLPFKITSPKSMLLVLMISISTSVFQGLYTFLFPLLAPYTTYESFRDDSGADWRRWTVRLIISAFLLPPVVALIYGLF